jgi:Flp pilus assembly protein TadG
VTGIAHLVRIGGHLRRCRLAACEAGATIVEFAMIVPVLITLMLGLIETGLLLTAQGILDGAATSAARIGSTGYTPANTTRSAYMANYIAAQAYGLIDPARLQVTARSYPNFSAIGEEGAGTVGYGDANDVVVYSLTYPWQGFTPFLGAAFGNITLNSTVTVRNEPPPPGAN